MKTTFLCALFLGLAAGAANATPVNFTCTTDPFTTSVVVFMTNSTDVTVRVINHNGTDYMPLGISTVTPHDLSALADKAKALAQLGNTYDVHLKATDCKVDAQNLVDCGGEASDTVNGHKISWVSVGTSKSVTTGPLLPAPNDETIVNVLLNIDGTDYDFAMNYPTAGCVQTTGAAGTNLK